MYRGWLYVLAATLVFSICQASLLDLADQIPPCGLSCLAERIPLSACHTFTNETCICTDAELFDSINECMAKSCTIMDRLTVAKLDAHACNKPKRHRILDEYIFIAIDLITLACLTIRMYMRYTTFSRWEMDDWIVMFMVVVYLAFLGLGHYVRVTAIGRDIWDLEPETITMALKLFFIDELFYTLVLGLCRISITLFLMRIFQSPAFSMIGFVVVGWVSLTTAVIILMTAFQCHPVRWNWDGWTGALGPASEACINVNALSYAAAGIGIAQDLAILFLPLPMVMGLKMALRRRLLTLFMFSLGIFVTITSCIRLRFLVQFSTSDNPTWDNADAVIWTHAEVVVAVLVLTMPALRMALATVAPRLFGSSNASTATPGAGSSSRPSRTGRKTPLSFSNGPSSGARSRARRSILQEDFLEVSSDDGGNGGGGEAHELGPVSPMSHDFTDSPTDPHFAPATRPDQTGRTIALGKGSQLRVREFNRLSDAYQPSVAPSRARSGSRPPSSTRSPSWSRPPSHLDTGRVPSWSQSPSHSDTGRVPSWSRPPSHSDTGRVPSWSQSPSHSETGLRPAVLR